MLVLLKQKKNSNKIIPILALAVLLVLVLAHPKSLGQTTDDLVKQKQAKQQQLTDVLNKINSIQSEIKQRQKLAGTLKNQIAIFNLQIAETQAQIVATQVKIDATNLEIADVTDQIIQTEKDINKQKQILKQLIGEINDLDQRTPLEIALENDNFTDFLNDLQYVTSVQERSQQTLTKIKQLKTELSLRQAQLKKQQDDLETYKSQLTIAQAGLNGQRSAKQQILDQTRGQERIYQKLLAQSQGLEEQIAREIFDLEVELRKRLGDKRLPSIKGLLAWPMDGYITQGYGATGFTKLGYNFHNGIDIAAPAGTVVTAAADGVVVNTGTGNGAYGNWAAIKHDIPTKSGVHQIISLYAHMSSFRLKVGQHLKQGDLVGFEGNTGNTTRLLYGPERGYHLHFTVFDVEGYGVADGKFTGIYGDYQVPYGATYNPLEFL